MRRTIQRPASSRQSSTPVAVSVASSKVEEALHVLPAEILQEQVDAIEQIQTTVFPPDVLAKTVPAELTAERMVDSAVVHVVTDNAQAFNKSLDNEKLQSFAEAFERAGVKSRAIAAEWAAEHPELSPPSVQYTHYAHRSGHETFWACPRKYYLEYLHCGTGIRKMPTKLALTVGSAVHVGLATLLQLVKDTGEITEAGIREVVIPAVHQYLEYSDTWQFLKEDERQEQLVLTAGLIWSFFFYRAPSFFKQFEVLTVERDWVEKLSVSDTVTLVTSSRPDAIVRDRNTNEIVVISWKTIDDIADYKRANFHQNLQTFLESYYGRNVLRRYLEEEYMPIVPDGMRGRVLMEYLAKQSEAYKTLPAEVDYTLTVFLVKGPRTAKLLNGEDISLEEVGSYSDQERVYKQQSPLCYRWESLGDSTLCGQAWTQRYYKEGNTSYNNIGKDFMSNPVPLDQVEEWVRSLNNGEVFPSVLADSRNLGNPLQKVIVDEEPEYWDGPRAGQMRQSFVEESQDIATSAAFMREFIASANEDGSNWEQTLNSYFRKHLTSCNNSAPSAGFPIKCEYKEMCVGSEQLVQIAPNAVQEGIWTRRIPHHEAERLGWEEKA